ncbi:AmtB Ammonia permease [Candidatus Nanopelagicaceae bacterium]|jgi:Amt family ammonium transporter|uniref:ammonium transporter n=1 Tax=Candidatus Planktophila lacus TaxID=1884913 RepID=UPI000BACB132|nr:ammonium transporter [Candidatus Planktophila lacus]ASY25217.1 ammonium transporter, Amt family [Candidatus Planktophila lacus]ASY29178.1 ammonium transporter, Amt family [Candidatus Planktophila lacus]
MEEIVLNSGDTAWVLASTALVLLMTPGLAFFYGGMVRTKSVLNMMMMSMVTIGIVSVIWVIYGFELAFGYKANSAWYGNISLSGLGGVVNDFTNNGGVYPIPVLVFAAFQLMFAIITPALISGAIADRTKFTAWAIFVAIWSTLVYFPVAHWVFAFGNKVGDTITGAGYLASRGVQDFAGGTAVHINAGAAGLALAIVIGKRVGWRKESMRPHSLPLVMLGAGLLWFGWFGFNAGSSLAANGTAALALINTQVAAAAAVLGWLLVEKIRNGHATSLGAASGAVAGLVAITPACAFVAPWAAVVIGLLAGAICALSVGIKYKLGFDDSLDVVAVHLIGGIWGSLAIGLFGSSAVNSLSLDGIFYGGGTALLGKQALGVGLVFAYSFIATLIIGYAIEKTIGFRVKKDAEVEGIDLNEHAETAYEMTSSSRGGSLL